MRSRIPVVILTYAMVTGLKDILFNSLQTSYLMMWIIKKSEYNQNDQTIFNRKSFWHRFMYVQNKRLIFSILELSSILNFINLHKKSWLNVLLWKFKVCLDNSFFKQQIFLKASHWTIAFVHKCQNITSLAMGVR